MIPRRGWRWVFAAYAGALFIGTHWPALEVHGPVPRSDLWVHVAVFCVWTLLLIRCGFFAPATARRNILLSVAAGACYAAIDEGLQAIPAIRRNAAWDDFAADLCGVLLAGAIAVMIASSGRRKP